jgi:hypothetical protein
VRTAVVGAQAPRIHHVPPYVSSAGQQAIEIAEIAGLYLDPWEKLVIGDALGETADGRWAAYRVGLEVPRQNGKGSVLEARELAGLFALGERLIIHSAHEQATASEHFRRILMLMEGVPEFDRRILKVVRGKGLESIELRDGHRIFFKTRTGGGGRGFTGDLVVFDEAMILAAAFMAALVPTMAARSMVGDPQLWFAGSAVDQQKTEHGVEFSRVRADALAGVERLAYFGWNVPYDNPDDVPDEVLDDPEAWGQANPGLGIRIAPQYIADERRALGRREFAVERLGVGDWPAPDGADSVINPDDWDALTDHGSEPSGAVCFAFDVSPDRSSAAICIAGRRTDGKHHIEVVKHERGTAWVVRRLVELVNAHPSIAVVCDARGPAGSLVSELQLHSVTVTPLNASEHAQGCGLLVDAVNDGALRHLGTPELTAAVRGAAKRPLGDAWAWSRKSSNVDISPLVGCTLALWGAVDGGALLGGGFEW